MRAVKSGVPFSFPRYRFACRTGRAGSGESDRILSEGKREEILPSTGRRKCVRFKAENAVRALKKKASSNYIKVRMVQRVSWFVKNVCLGVKDRSDGVVQSKGKNRSRNNNVQWSG